MNAKLMILPASEANAIRLIRIPSDFEEHEAFRHVTGIIASVEEDGDYEWDDIAAKLEAHNFEIVDFIQGPSLDTK